MGSQEVQRKSFEMRLFTFAFVLEVIYGQDVSCDRIKKWAVLRKIDADLLTIIWQTSRSFQLSASYKDSGNSEKALEYMREFENSSTKLDEEFEARFCSYSKRFDPIMNLVKLIIPSYDDDLIAKGIDGLVAEKFV